MQQSKTALLIIDVINKMDFDGGEDLLENGLEMMDNLHTFKQEAKAKNIPVIYVNDNFGLWQDNAEEIVEECRKGIGRPIVEKMRPANDDFFVIKPKHSGFYGTQLDILLTQMGVDRLILTGLTGDMCVLFTANGAYMREYDLYIPEDLVASEDKNDNSNALQIMKRSLFADITPSVEFNFEKVINQ
ncbi:putative isochorismatase family protein YaaI [Thalassobacillus devorans]|uniref:Isochorismatase family protein YaaI n=1 Tax=Thalassobacillus devorans TaxID=279813 RepID=A0ABQ1PR31_9BACI|nr:isochorismatase family cysteine hydrolase [Thalassobacillus devorans]NIK30600.1 nicotinamidase-related amidase [Thalassobacillus devorans]GGD01652.1 putative isochorismatase family protein YaaI [Thalassobacillus devorans]